LRTVKLYTGLKYIVSHSKCQNKGADEGRGGEYWQREDCREIQRKRVKGTEKQRGKINKMSKMQIGKRSWNKRNKR
jgi:hypothetical protein